MKISLMNAFIIFIGISVCVGIGVRVHKSFQPVHINGSKYWPYADSLRIDCPSCGMRYMITVSPRVDKTETDPAFLPMQCGTCKYQWRMLTKYDGAELLGKHD